MALQAFLQERLRHALPGQHAQQQMSAMPENLERFIVKERPNVRHGSVLVAFYFHEGEWFIPLMKRPDYDGVHGGQVSFPGGKREEQDEDLIATALREAHEEVGIFQEQVKVIGQLTELYIPPSNIKVLPIVGFLNKRPNFNPNRYEVARIIEMPVRHLLEPSRIKSASVKVLGGISLTAPYFDIDNEIVWGATAMILSELKALLLEIDAKL